MPKLEIHNEPPFERPYRPVGLNTSLTKAFPLVSMAEKLMEEAASATSGRAALTLARGDELTIVLTDSMLKAIGKAINIRVSSHRASTIPIIVMGNTPITDSYLGKVDHLRIAGITQGFWSINPKPLDGQKTLETTNRRGFMRFDTYESFQHSIIELLSMPMNFFSGMKSKEGLGRFIEFANDASTYQQKAERFLKLLQDGEYEEK